jgi:hypothetical protein
MSMKLLFSMDGKKIFGAQIVGGAGRREKESTPLP